MVIIFVTVSGRKDGRLVQETYAHKVYSGADRRQDAQRHPDHHRRQHLRGARPARARPPAASGFLRQEEIGLADFLANRFGQYYAREERVLRSA